MKNMQLKRTILIPLIIVMAFSAMNLISSYKTGEYLFFDFFLRLMPEVEEEEDIVLLNIDDLAIANVGMYPWSRSILADGLLLMKEMGATYAVFDIEYTEESPMGLNSDFLKNDIPKVLNYEFGNISQNVTGLFQAIASGNIPLSEAEDYIYQLDELTESSKNELNKKIHSIARDNDLYFGQATRYFENAYYTVLITQQKEKEYSAEFKQWVCDNMSLNVKSSKDSLPLKGLDIRPAIAPITKNSAGVGFPNVQIDEDGVRRRVNLLSEANGYYFPQLSFQVIYEILGRPEIELSKDYILLKQAVFPEGKTKDVKIPLDNEGNFVINWPHKDFEDSFEQLSYYYLVLHKKQESLLVQNLRIMEEAGYLKYYSGNSSFLEIYDYAKDLQEEMLDGKSLDRRDEYRQIRDKFFAEADNFLNGDTKKLLLDRIEQILQSPDFDENTKTQYQSIKDSVNTSFSETAGIMNSLKKTRGTLSEKIDGAICYIGWTGTATTDIGANPFDKSYDNVGTHASIANTILNEKFFDILPVWMSILLAIIIVLAYYFLVQGLSPLKGIITGIAFIFFILVAAFILFRTTGLYFPVFTPVISTVTSFIALTILNFLSTSREKVFIRNAFGQYLSNDVINDLLENPEKLNLGGEKKRLTALFTDVKGFSTISEAMDPTDLVNLLNMYLTEMSDTIMEQRGTIDKFEGDAIISFFGAPTDFSDHASRACLSAIRMKRAENIMNEKIERDKLSPYPLLTRIGINTGDMVVGNMGTAKKMDYTMMGNAVNLAARLEGVNKRYGTWLLISEYTYDAGGKNFSVRRLDRVRVVGINTPVRLFELVEEKNHLSKEKKELIGYFEEGLNYFEQRDWARAEKYFTQALKINKTDGPGLYYLERCKTYKENPPAEDWDGVYNLTEK